jgi:uncharacterized protein (TIGR03435 family)
MLGPMLQAVLETRFALKIRSEMNDEPAYALTVAKSGFKVQPFLGSCTPENRPPPETPVKEPCPRNTPQDWNWPMNLDTFVWWLGTDPWIDVPIINNSAIKGYFRFNFEPFTKLHGPLVDPDQSMEHLRNALDDIGLRLVATTAPRRHLVIDHVERPSEN